jgi:serine protease Do
MQTRSFLAALAALGFFTLGALVGGHSSNPFAVHAQAAAATTQSQPEAARGAALPDFASIVQQNGPAVVNITTAGTRKAAAEFPFPFPFRFGPPHGGEVPTQGQGSGFIISADGIVLTNAHVVDGAREVTVKLTDRREFHAKVLGADPATDVAVLRIDAKGLPTVKLGDPARTRVGDWVVAIGSPFGFENSVTAGIVSAKGRSLPGDTYVPFIQTDVAVNPGNSGGPLFNMAGEVIGINSQIYSRSGGYQGLSFAIPTDVVLKVKDQIVATGRAQHARLGVSVQPVNQALAESFGLPRAEGALVAAVVPGSAAEKAGVESGDVVLKFNDKAIDGGAELAAMVGQSAPGDKARLQIWRKGAQREIVVTLGKSEDDGATRASADGAGEGRLGLAVRPLTADERAAANVKGGLLVEDVNGPAERAGIQPGDIVLQAGGKSVNSVADLRAATRGGKSVALLVQRDGQRIFVPLQAAG